MPILPRNGKPASNKPTIFLRLLFSHLVLLTVCCIAAGILTMYLFGPNSAYRMLSEPIILFPVVLALIGIAGILASLSAGHIAAPFEEITDAINSDDPFAGIHTFDLPIGTKEADDLLAAMRRYQDGAASSQRRGKAAAARAADGKLIVVVVNRNGIIQKANPAAETLTGMKAGVMAYRRFMDVFVAPEAKETARQLLEKADKDDEQLHNAVLAWKNDNSTLNRIRWNSTNVFDAAGHKSRLMLFGIEVKTK